MATANIVVLIGNCTRDTELQYLPSGMALAKIGLAVTERYKDKDGKQKEDVCFVDCTAWGKTAEVAAEYCHKGSPVFIQGRLRFEQWTSQDGQKRSKHTVNCDRLQLLGPKPERTDEGYQPSPPNEGVDEPAPEAEDGVPF